MIGGGVAGTLLLKSIQADGVDCTVVGVLDDGVDIATEIYNGVKILGAIDDLPTLLDLYKIDQIIIVIPSERGKLFRKIVLLAGHYKDKVEILILPRASEVVFNAQVSFSSVRPLEIVDLVGEAIIKIDQERTSEEMRGKTVFITGAGGSIGSELSKQIFLCQPKKLILLDSVEKNLFYVVQEIEKLKKINPHTHLECVLGNVLNEALLSRIFTENSVDVVFHAAAYKHVPILETSVYEAVLNNVYATHILAEAAGKHGVTSFVLISTDKAVKPLNVMGFTKKIAEAIIERFDALYPNTVYTAVRFGNVFNSSGSAIELFCQQLAAGSTVTITDPEMTRYFMSIPEAVQLILQAWIMAEKKQLFMLEMGDPISIIELAKCLGIIYGYTLDTLKFNIIGPRPGEKIHEELYNESDEEKSSTSHRRIFKVEKKKKVDYTTFDSHLKRLFLELKTDDAKNHSEKGAIALKQLLYA